MATGAATGINISPQQKEVILRPLQLAATFAAAGGAPGTDAYRWYIPAKPQSQGIKIQAVRIIIPGKVGTAGTASVDVRNQTTSVLSAVVSSGANATTPYTTTGTLANNGWEIVAPGNYVRLDWTMSAGTQTSLTGYQAIAVQIDYDNL